MYQIKDFYGNELTVKPRLELYSVRDFMGKEMPGLAIVLDHVTEGAEPEEFCMLTVSFGEFIGMKNCTYIDVNNCDFTDQLIEQGIAAPTGLFKHSGFCKYPLWSFTEQSLRDMGAENYEKYNAAYEQYMEEQFGSREEDEDEENESMREEKLFDVNFTLSSPACFVISSSSKEEAEEEAERMLSEEFSKEEIMEKLRDAVNYGGLKISSIVPVNGEEEKKEEEEIRIRRIAGEICGLFEELLERHDIYIPDEDREGDEEEACLYGTTYYDLEADVTDILLSLIKKIKEKPEAEINAEDY